MLAVFMSASQSSARRTTPAQRLTKLVGRRRQPQFLHGLLDRKAAGPLAWREFPEARDVLPHDRLRWHQQESVFDEPAHVVAGLVLRPLERIGANVEYPGQA